MLFLVLSQAGFDELKSIANPQQDHIWLNKGLFTASDISTYNDQGWNMKEFSETIKIDNEQSIVKAVKYLEKKFPQEDIEVEYL